jgi:hypothetical protein
LLGKIGGGQVRPIVRGTESEQFAGVRVVEVIIQAAREMNLYLICVLILLQSRSGRSSAAKRSGCGTKDLFASAPISC